jgi:regulator of protease activity HflC (stomatin/prohibitin superfamily)
MNDHEIIWMWAKRVIGAVAATVIIGMAGCPVYNVWSSKMDGEAILAHAHAARMVAVTQAEAEREAASKRAEAIKIVGQAAKDFPEYRQQEFIGAFAEALHNGKITQIIYVPTEANIPIIEARSPQQKK